MSLNPITAWALLREAAVDAGDSILLTAATSTVSNLIGILARQRGVNVIGLVRGQAAAARVRCRADHVLSTDQPSLAAEIAEIAGAHAVKALLDSVGGPLIPTLLETVAPGSRIIAYGVQDRGPAVVTNAMLIYSNLTWQGFGIDRWLEQLAPAELQTMYDELWTMLRDGILTLPVASTHGLTDFRDALLADAAQGRSGKVILVS
jgi:NADPH:quinone reductase-like Zn-dependent oxidoreductase